MLQRTCSPCGLNAVVCVLRGAVAEQTLQQGQRSMQMAAVVVLLVNAEDVRDRGAGVSKRELALASDVIKEGRALLIVANKLDACSEDERSAVSPRLICCAWQGNVQQKGFLAVQKR